MTATMGDKKRRVCRTHVSPVLLFVFAFVLMPGMSAYTPRSAVAGPPATLTDDRATGKAAQAMRSVKERRFCRPDASGQLRHCRRLLPDIKTSTVPGRNRWLRSPSALRNGHRAARKKTCSDGVPRSKCRGPSRSRETHNNSKAGHRAKHRAGDRVRDGVRYDARKNTMSQHMRRSVLYKEQVPDSPLALPSASVHVRLERIPVSVFARMLAVAVGHDIVSETGLKDELHGGFDNMPWRQVVDAFATLHHWEVLDMGQAMLIRKRAKKAANVSQAGHDKKNPTGNTDKPALSPERSDLLRLRHISPDTLRKMAERLFQGRNKPSIATDAGARAVVVSGDEVAVDMVYRLARKLDVPERQVFIEAFIIEAGSDFERRLGARLGYEMVRRNSRIAGVVRPTDPSEGVVLGGTGNLVADLAVAGAAGGVGFLVDRNRLKLELTALERKGDTRILSNPRIFTLNNRKAVIFQGDEIPYLSTSDNGTQTEFKEAGVRLEVTPTVVGENQLMIKVAVNKDSVDTRLSNPPITRRRIETNLLVTDGALAAIGGIYFNTRVGGVTSVPWLGRIPVIGQAFRNVNRQNDVKELLVFIVPTII